MKDVKVTVGLIERRRDGSVRLILLFVNDSAGAVRVGFDYGSTLARDERGIQYRVTAGTSRTSENPIPAATLQAGGQVERVIEMPPVGAEARTLTIALGQPSSLGDLARFAPFVVSLPVAGVR